MMLCQSLLGGNTSDKEHRRILIERSGHGGHGTSQ